MESILNQLYDIAYATPHAERGPIFAVIEALEEEM